MNQNLSTTTSTEARALELLGSGVAAETVASALGVSVSRISQLLSDEGFANQVAELRFQNLQKHNTRDSKYDSLEDPLSGKLEENLPMMMRPLEILKAIQIVNGAKRRGQNAPDSILQGSTIVKLVLPTQIVNQFSVTTNIQNQVVKAGEQDLITIQSSTLLQNLKETESLNADIPSKRSTESARGSAGGNERSAKTA